ncbi:protein POLR1D-like [Penaeus japonicus]|uniref:protein POLR1D-like n=1 Tax=Penaeus japonicus TaxID=27405 RepID=UPI001C7166E2|nr:protein POLR1D-like [Penaeus japonicus]
MPTDDELSKLAEEALLREAKRGAQRAETCGPSGWLKNRLPSTNKTFLHNTILGALAANRAQERKEKHQSERGKRKREQEEKERNTYKRVYLHASTKRNNSLANTSKTGSQHEESSREPKPKSKNEKLMIWSENGLEISSSNRLTEKCKSKDRKNAINDVSSKKDRSKVLSRNINFVSSTLDDETET